MNVPPVDEQPLVEIECWYPIQDAIGYRLVGIVPATGRARMTSALVEFDAEAGQAVTRSGRVYRLIGPADPDMGALIVRRYMVLRGLDITQAALADPSELPELLHIVNGLPGPGRVRH